VSGRAKKGAGEQTLRGLGVSDGIVVGQVVRLHNGTPQVYRITIDEADLERETHRLRAAIRLSRRQLLAIKARAETELGAEHAYIFDAHLLMLEDQKLLDDTEKFIRDERVNAEWAIRVVADRFLAVYSDIKDEYLRERGSDIEDITQRLLVALSGGERPDAPVLTENAVIVAENLMPSAVAELDYDYARAIATDTGGWTSHTAIIARALGIPAVVGLRDLYRRSRTGDEVIVDATHGEVVLHPSTATVKRYESTTAKPVETRSVSVDSRPSPVVTLDGREIRLRANVELPAEYDDVKIYGASGIGLYRSEFLLSRRGVIPTEDEQYEAYKRIAELGGDDGATIRLFDLGGDKVGRRGLESEQNPALGLRAIRFGLKNQDVLRVQARAVYRASIHGRLNIVLPMISDVSDVRRAKKLIEKEQACLVAENIPVGHVGIGAMIEVPSAVVLADGIAREVDFFSLGTNDLVQYLLAVDRSNDDVADWFRTLHPSVLMSIKSTLEAAQNSGIPTVVCGEMAGTPAYSVILTGLGAMELSMISTSIPRIRNVLSKIRYSEATEIATKCIECVTADDAEEMVRVQFSERWPELFSTKALPVRKDKT
jgi:phosphoenolpyruvate-protein phosphotransferase (PTS system enzyme I)